MRTFLIAPLLVTGVAMASGPAPYTLVPQSQVAGGRSSSANYTIDVSMDAGAATASEALALRCGFSGVLSDVMGLALLPSPAVMNEENSLSLSSALAMDDDSRNSVSVTEVLWSVHSGPLSMPLHGLLSAGAVYGETPGLVVGTYGLLDASLPVTVVNTNPDNFGIYAGDQMDDAWQVEHFGVDNPNAAPFLDPDADGYQNFFEYHAGLVPVDPESTFRLRVQRVPGDPSLTEIVFSPIFPGRTYTVEKNPNLSEVWKPLSGKVPVSDEKDERTVTDTQSDPERRFYRVDVVRD